MKHVNLEEGQIREAAYYIWLQDGQPAGRDEEHWLKAVDALTPAKPKRKTAAKKPAVKAAAKKPATKAAPKRAAAPKAKTKAKAAAN